MSVTSDEQTVDLKNKEESQQKKYVIPIMLLPDKPLGFIDWLVAHNLSLSEKLEQQIGGNRVYNR
jgi:hypothetical protein